MSLSDEIAPIKAQIEANLAKCSKLAEWFRVNLSPHPNERKAKLDLLGHLIAENERLEKMRDDVFDSRLERMKPK